MNRLFSQGKELPSVRKNITQTPEEAFYAFDGRPIKAFTSNFRDYVYEEKPCNDDY